MKKTQVGDFSIVSEGRGIPVLIMGPPEVFIATMPDELKQYCVFYGINYPFKMDGSEKKIPLQYQLSHWKSINDVCDFYHDIGYAFCRKLGCEKFIVIRPSMLGAVADLMCQRHKDHVLGSCFLSLAETAEVADTKFEDNDINDDVVFGTAFKDGKAIEDFHFYLDALHEDAGKDFNDVETFRPIWVELWKKGTDNIQTQMVLLRVLAGYEIGDSELNTLLIAGENDGRQPVRKVKEFRLPLNYKRVILPGGHITHFEFHLEFADVFIGWLEETGIKRPESKIADRTIALRKINADLKEEIKRRQIVEGELRTSRTRYKTLTTISPVGIFRFNKNTRLVDANAVFIRLTDLKDKVVFLKDFLSKIESQNLEDLRKLIKKLDHEQDIIKFECQFTHSGRKYWVLCQMVKETVGNDGISYVGTLTDLTKRRKAETLAYHHQNELAHYSRVNTLAEMVTGISHELAHPLSCVVQYAGALQNTLNNNHKVDVEYANHILRKVEKNTERAGVILHKIKKFITKKEIQKADILIDDLVKEVVSLLKFELLDTGITLKMQIHDERLRIMGDAIQIQQVILNIVKNAIEAIKESNSRNKNITIRTKKSDSNYVGIYIRDTGPGITNNKIKTIFEPFYSTKTKGTGMGLSISSTILKSHAGSLTVESEPKIGTTFLIRLPLTKHMSTQREVYA